MGPQPLIGSLCMPAFSAQHTGLAGLICRDSVNGPTWTKRGAVFCRNEKGAVSLAINASTSMHHVCIHQDSFCPAIHQLATGPLAFVKNLEANVTALGLDIDQLGSAVGALEGFVDRLGARDHVLTEQSKTIKALSNGMETLRQKVWDCSCNGELIIITRIVD